MSTNVSLDNYNLPSIKGAYLKRPSLDKELYKALIDENFQVVIMQGRPGSGKTSQAIDFGIHFNKIEQVVYLNANSADRLDVEYRKFANSYLKLNTDKLKKSELINEVYENMRDRKVLFIFDDLTKLKYCRDYIINLPSGAFALITTKNMSFKIDAEFDKLKLIQQTAFDKKEASDYIRYEIDHAITDESIRDLIRHFYSDELQGILPFYLKKTCVYLNLFHATRTTQVLLNAVYRTEADFNYLKLLENSLSQQDRQLVLCLSFFDCTFVPRQLLEDAVTHDSEQYFNNQLRNLQNKGIIESAGENGFLIHEMIHREIVQIAQNEKSTYLRDFFFRLVNILNEKINLKNMPGLCYYYGSAKKVTNLNNFKSYWSVGKLKKKELVISICQILFKLSIFSFYYMNNYLQSFQFCDDLMDHLYMLDEENILKNQLGSKGEHDATTLIQFSNRFAKKLYHIGLVYDRLNCYSNAIQVKKQCIRLIENTDEKKDLGDCYKSISFSYEMRGDFKKSIKYRKKFENLADDELFIDSRYSSDFKIEPQKTPSDIFRRAVGLYEDENYQDAISLFQKAIILYKSLSSNEIKNVSKCYEMIGVCHFKMNNCKNSLTNLNEALFLLNKIYPTGIHLDIASIFNRQAANYEFSGDWVKANECRMRELNIRENFSSTLINGNNREYFDCLFNLGQNYKNLSDYELALDYLNRALEQTDHDELDEAATLNQIGDVYLKKGQYNEAKTNLEKSLDIRKQKLNVNHKDMIESNYNMGLVYEKIGRQSKAKEYFRKALKQ